MLENRRAFLKLAGVAAGTGAAGYAIGDREDPRFHGLSIRGHGEAAEGVWHRMKLVGQPIMDAQLLFFLGAARNGLTDIGEVLDTALRITPGDERSWFDAWLRTAARVHRYALEAEKAGHLLSASSHFLRAGAYYRAGLIRYADHRDPRLVEACRSALAAHDRALALRGTESTAVEIPYGRKSLHGRLHFTPKAQLAPALILFQGMHAWPEDTHWVIDGALERGYHVLSFHGPGQGVTLRYHALPFRHDWEHAVAPVLDFAATVARIDPERCVLMGLSFGGALAPRAAAFDHRLRALIANPGVLNWGRAMRRHFDSVPGFITLLEERPDDFDLAAGSLMKAWPDAAWWFEDAGWKHGVSKPHQLIAELDRFDNTEIAGRIRCPTLIMEGSGEDATPGEARALYDSLRCPKTWLEFDDSTAAQTHCQGGGTALAQAWMFDWLDQELA